VKQTFLLHAELETFLESAVLALVTMMLINRTTVISATRVRQVATHGTLEETLAAFARQHAVVLTGTFVTAYSAFQTADDDRTAAVLNARLDRQVRLEVRSIGRPRPGGYPISGAERWRTYAAVVVVIVVIIVSGSRVRNGSPSSYGRTARRRADKSARSTIHHRRPRSAGHLRRR